MRTVAEGMYESVPHGDFRIFESYARVVRGARELIYIENQFLWAPELVSIIADKLRDPPTPGFRVVILLPAKANNGADDTQGQLSVLAAADDGHGRLLGATIRSLSPAGGRADPLYVHAKVCVVDDRWLIVGSANLNAHSFFNDTEVCVVTDDAHLARDTRVRLWAEHLELGEDDVAARPRASCWMTTGCRSPASSSHGARPARPLRTACSSCRASPSGPGAWWVRCRASSTTAEPIAYDLAVRSAGTQQTRRSGKRRSPPPCPRLLARDRGR